LEALHDLGRSLGSCWSVVGLVLLCAPAALAVHEFTAYRMNQYSLGGAEFGCKSNLVNYEARSVHAKVVTRRCVLLNMGEVGVDRMRELLAGKAGSLLIAVPSNTSQLSKQEIENWNEVEEALMEGSTETSVFFTFQQPQLQAIFHEVKTGLNSDHAPTAAAALGNVFHSNGYQVVGYAPTPAPAKQSTLFTVQGKLTTQSRESNPSIVLVAHFDSYGISPHLATSTNSNGSGVAALLEIARLLSKLYTTPGSSPKYDILFLLAGGGKLNYMASKLWLEKRITSDTPEGIMLADAEYVLCLDTVGEKELHLHVSKQPKEGTPAHKMLSVIQEAAQSLYNTSINIVPKKVNLGNPMFSWQHELFTVKRMAAGTLSNFPAHSALGRLNTFDSTVNIEALYEHSHILAEAVARYVSNVTDSSVSILHKSNVPNKALLQRTTEFLGSTPRAAVLLQRDSPVISFLEQTLPKFITEVMVSELKASKRDPEFQFFDQTETRLFTYNVKPAVFDLFLALAVFLYLAAVYLCVKSVPMLITCMYQYRKLKNS